MILRAITALLTAAGLAFAAPAVASNARHALVIGNAAYPSMPLLNPVNDARAMALLLERLGFSVERVENASLARMHEAVRRFGERLRAGGAGLVYYAGHGVQVGGRNWLLPVDAAIAHEDEVPFKAFDAQAILAKMTTAGNGLNLLILDACRNNPFARATRSAQSGLAQMDAPVGTLVAFATAPGAEAADGNGANGVYTAHLLRHMAEPGIKVEDVFKRVRADVRRETRGRQIPWENTSLEGDFFFAGEAARAGSASSAGNSSGPGSATGASAQSAVPTQPPRSTPPPPPPAAAVSPAPLAATRSSAGFSFSRAESEIERNWAAKHAPAPPACKPDRPLVIALEERASGSAAHVLAGARGIATIALADRLKASGAQLVSDAGPGRAVLHGTITAQASANRMVALGEVSLTSALTLVDARGMITPLLAREEAFSGSDPTAALQGLAQRHAADLGRQVFAALCDGR